MKVTVKQLKALIAEASTIPTWVKAGREMDWIAGSFEDLAIQEQELEKTRKQLIKRIVDLRKGAEYGLDLQLEEVLRKIQMNISLGDAAKVVRQSATSLKTAKR